VTAPVGHYTGMRAHKRMQQSTRGLWCAGAAGRRSARLRASLGGFAAGRRAVYGRFTAGVS
jgi:hypothetical protein